MPLALTVDNSLDVASSTYRIRNIFAASGQISTSDGALKTVRVSGMTAAERAWAAAIKVVAYQFTSQVVAKGAAKARLHWGVVAQQVYAAGIASGIADPFAYAFLCRDPLTVTQQQPVQIERQVTESVSIEQDSYAVANGLAVLTRTPTSVSQPVFDLWPVVDAAGQPVLEPDGSPMIYRAPRMETVTVMQDVQVPALDATGTPILRWGVRYDELAMFFAAAGRVVA